MKKIPIILMLSAMLLTSFVACKNEDPPVAKPPVSEDSGKDTEDISNDTEDNGNDTENIDENVNLPKLDPPSDEIIEEIKTSWYEQHGETVEWVPGRNLFTNIGFYYGTYNGYVIIVSKGMATVVSSIYIGNEFFYFGSSATIFAYKDGVFDRLSRVYEEGNISDEQLAELAKYHTDKTFPGYDKAMEIIQAYVAVPEHEWLDTTDIELWVYGKFENAWVVWVEYNEVWENDDNSTYTEIIDGITFEFTSPWFYEVYSNGSFYTISEAFEQGILSSQDIRTLYHNTTNELSENYCDIEKLKK